MNFRVMVSAPYMLPFPEEFRAQLAAVKIEITEMCVAERLDEKTLLAVIEDFDGVICGDDCFTESVLQKARKLKVISKWGTGIDSIDTNAAHQLGIRVCNTPNAFTEPVADTTFGYILNFARQLSRMDREMKNGLWTKPDSISLAECTLGIVGMGNIGRAVARRAKAFGMKIIAHDIKPISESLINEVEMSAVSLIELLHQSDFITLHCDFNPTSFHLLNRATFAAMKPTAYLINTARGAIVDETALIECLNDNKLSGAALDVYETEPLPPESPLRQFENCFLASHNSNNSPAARRKVHESTIANLICGLYETAAQIDAQ